MGVETCDDCGGQVGDSAETCPHCGSNANHLRRLQPLQEEAEKKRRAEQAEAEKKRRAEAEKKSKRKTYIIVAIVVLVLLVALVAGGGSSSDYNSYDERLARCYFKEERPGYDFAGGGAKDHPAMAVCMDRVKK